MAFLTQTMLGTLHMNPADSPLSLSSTAPEWRATFATVNQAALQDTGTARASAIVDVATDFYNNVYSLGSASFGSNGFATITKQDSEGAVEWQKFYTINGTPSYITVDSLNSTIWVLFRTIFQGKFTASILAKLDMSGEIVALYQIALSGLLYNPAGMTLDATGNVCIYGTFANNAVIGYTEINPTFIIKVSRFGNLISKLTYDKILLGAIKSLVIDSDSNMYLSGPGTLIVKLGPNGNVIWQTSYNDTFAAMVVNQTVSKVIVDAEGNSYLTVGVGGTVLMKFSPQGALIWSRQFSDTGAVSLAFDDEGNILTHGTIRLTSGTVVLTGQSVTSFTPAGKFNWKKNISYTNRTLNFAKLEFSTDGAMLLPGLFGGNQIGISVAPQVGLLAKMKFKESLATTYGDSTEFRIINGPYAAVKHTPKFTGSVKIVLEPANLNRTFTVTPISLANPSSSTEISYAVTLV